MKISKPFLLMALAIVAVSLTSLQLLAQTCVSCDSIKSNVKVGYNNNVSSSWEKQSILGNNNTTSRNNAVAIGTNSTASFSHSYVFGSNSASNGIHSYAIGSNSIAQSSYSFAIGYSAKSMFGNAFTVGNFTHSDAVGAYVFGLGVSSAIPLVNNVGNSLVIGFLSTKPTLFVSKSEYSANYDLTGKVGIGNVTSPQAKLHIRADAQEDATLLLEPSDYRRNAAALYMLDANTGFFATYEEGLRINTDLERGINFYASSFNFLEGRVGINIEHPEYDLDVGGDARVNGGFFTNALLINNTLTITNGRIGRFANGTASQPAYSFSGNHGTGMFQPAAGILAFSTGGTERVRIASNGDVGIGTTSNMQINGNASMFAGVTPKLHIRPSNNQGEYQEMVLLQQSYNGTSALRRLGYIMKLGGTAENEVDKMGGIVLDSESEWGNSPKLHLVTANKKRLTIINNGSIGIGTTSPEKKLHVVGQSQFNGDMWVASANVYVEGEIRAKKFRATYNPWPDYVFDPDYELPGLCEIEHFVTTNRHLPGLPSAAEVETEGFELAEMNGLLLKKIEELTLYLIDQQKEINSLKEKMSRIENQ